MARLTAIWTVLISFAVAALLMAPGPLEVSCNPVLIVSSASNTPVQLGGVNTKRELAWVTAVASGAQYFVKFYDSNVAPVINTTTPTMIVGSGGNAATPTTLTPYEPPQFLTGLWVLLTANITTDTGTVSNNVGAVTVCWN